MRVPILIVGAGPAGLCSSILLSRLGVRSLVVERHPFTSIHPKATAISTRTMELFRAWGIESRIRELALSVEFSSSVRDNLSAPEVERRSLGFPTREEAAAYSPTFPAVLAQDLLEPILLDGASSPIRRRLGIATMGVERIGEYLSILFRADIDAIIGPERFGLYMLLGLGGPAPTVALPTSNDGRWVLATPWRGDLRPLSSLGPADLVDLVRRAARRPDLGVDVLDHQLIGIGAEIAERFRDGNVFLVGDAAHRTAPTGGTGMNTAIHSAHNLMWKLAAVLSGVAGSDLLDTYEPERRPSGERNLLRSRGQLQGVSGVAADMGVVYSSGAVVAEADGERHAVIEPTMTACVGSRAPHVWLDADGHVLSTIDVADGRLVLMTGVAGATWREAARTVRATLGVPLGAVTIGGPELRDLSERWRSACGIDADGAVLVRPDGHIAWRSASAAADAAATLAQVVARVLGLPIEQRLEVVASLAGEAGRRCA